MRSSENEGRVLVVDDELVNRELLEEDLVDRGFTVDCAPDGPSALRKAKAQRFNVIVLDISMPGMDGFEVCRQLKKDPATAVVPVLFLTAHKSEEIAVRALNAGGNDFVEKPYTPAILTARLRSQVAIHRAHEQLLRLATRDELTGLLNRRAGTSLLRKQIAITAMEPEHECSVLMLDVDHFKAINDVQGHAVGDQALAALARTLTATVGSRGEVVRWGGEEFLIILPSARLSDALTVADRACASVRTIHLGNARLSVSVGASSLRSLGREDAHRDPFDAVLASADRALYRAKHEGRDRVVKCTLPPPALDVG